MSDTNHELDTKKRERGCECHQEEGDSPCVVHGLYEADTPARTCADHWGDDCQNCDLAERSNAPASADASLWCDNCEESMDREGDNPAGVCPVCWDSYLADKAVLDACAGLTESDLEELNHQTLRRGAVARAELARRGLKP